jgi:PAS domain S-box-containing protein
MHQSQDMDWYQKFLQNCPMMVLFLDEDGAIRDLSRQLLERLGYEDTDVLGRYPQDFCTPTSRDTMMRVYMPKLRKEKELNGAEIDLIGIDGKMIPLISHVRLVMNDEGRGHRTFVFFFDKQHEYLDYFKLLYRKSPAMLFTLNNKGAITDVSNRWIRKMGYDLTDVLGEPISNFLVVESELTQDIDTHPDDLSLDNAPAAFIRKDGALMEALVNARIDLRDPEKPVTYFAVKDVTEQNKLNRQLQVVAKENVRLRQELENERDYLREEVKVAMNFGQIIGESIELRKMLSKIEAVADTSASVLVQGESGTGKELIARVIHDQSRRSSGPLVKVNCAAIPAELFESEFFGHAKGAFTGAYKDRIGKFAFADGGTLFLDEIAEIPMDLQSKLLRVIQEGEFTPVGENRIIKTDIRLVAATNKDLESLINDGKFREDLFYRISVFPINVPSLRERGDDVIQIASHFLQLACNELGKRPMLLGKKDTNLLTQYGWPGNIRELKNVIERSVILSNDQELRLDIAMSDLSDHSKRYAIPTSSLVLKHDIMTDDDLDVLHRSNILKALEVCNWRVSGAGGAAEVLGVKPTTLYDRMKRHDLRKSRSLENKVIK